MKKNYFFYLVSLENVIILIYGVLISFFSFADFRMWIEAFTYFFV